MLHAYAASTYDATLAGYADAAEDESTQATADALAASLWAAGEVAGDPWALAQGVPVGRGAAPLSGPCCEEPAS